MPLGAPPVAQEAPRLTNLKEVGDHVRELDTRVLALEVWLQQKIEDLVITVLETGLLDKAQSMVAESEKMLRAEFVQGMTQIQKAVVAVKPQLTVATTGRVASPPKDSLPTMAGAAAQSLRGPARLGGSPSAPNLGGSANVPPLGSTLKPLTDKGSRAEVLDLQ